MIRIKLNLLWSIKQLIVLLMGSSWLHSCGTWTFLCPGSEPLRTSGGISTWGAPSQHPHPRVACGLPRGSQSGTGMGRQWRVSILEDFLEEENGENWAEKRHSCFHWESHRAKPYMTFILHDQPVTSVLLSPFPEENKGPDWQSDMCKITAPVEGSKILILICWALRGGLSSEAVQTGNGGRIPALGQLPTHPGRRWAGRKQLPEARGTRQTRVPGNDPDPGSFLWARPVPLANCCLPFLVLSVREQRKLGQRPGMARRVLKPQRGALPDLSHHHAPPPAAPGSQEETQSRILEVLCCLPRLELRLGQGADKARGEMCVERKDGKCGVKTVRLEVKRLGPDLVPGPPPPLPRDPGRVSEPPYPSDQVVILEYPSQLGSLPTLTMQVY